MPKQIITFHTVLQSIPTFLQKTTKNERWKILHREGFIYSQSTKENKHTSKLQLIIQRPKSKTKHLNV